MAERRWNALDILGFRRSTTRVEELAVAIGANEESASPRGELAAPPPPSTPVAYLDVFDYDSERIRVAPHPGMLGFVR
jgi:hypothetical protein